MTKLLHTTFYIFLSYSLTGQCSILSPEDILPETTTNINLSINQLDNDQLGSNSICAVYLEFEHGRLENLRFNLISPDGDVVTLIGPGTQSGAFTPSINWNVTFFPCLVFVSPDTGFSEEWSNVQQWQSFSNYTGSYHPHDGCFDFMSGSATGDWTLEIINLGTNTGKLIYFEIEFCDSSGLQCATCNPVVSNFTEDFILVCEGDPFFNSLAPEFVTTPDPASSEFFTLAIEGPAGLEFVDDITRVDDLESGEYTICAVVADTLLSSVILGTTSIAGLEILSDQIACMAITTPCMTIEVRDIQQLEAMPMVLCEGDTLIFNGEQFTSPIDTIIYADDLGLAPCEKATQLIITETIINLDLRMPPSQLLCGQPILLNASTSASTGNNLSFSWSTTDGNIVSGIGPIAQVDQSGHYYLELESDGCTERDSIMITGSSDLEVSLAAMNRSCAADSFEVTAEAIQTLPSGFDFMITGLATPAGPLVIDPGISEVIMIPEEGEYYISTAYGNCISTDTITLQDNLEAWTMTVEVSDTLGCDGQGVDISISSANPILIYDIIGPESVFGTPSGISVQTAGFYDVIATDGNQCSSMTTVEVIADEAFPELMVDSIFRACDSQVGVNLTAQVTGLLDSLVWQGPSGESYYDQGALITEAGSYSVTAYGSNGCSTTDTLVYTISDEEVLKEEYSTAIECEGDSILVDALFDNFIGVDITWSTPMVENFSSDVSFYISTAGTYTATVIDSRGCKATKTYLIADNSEDIGLGTFELSLADGDCDGMTVQMIGYVTGLVSVVINGEESDINPEYELPAGSYSFLLTDENDCQKELEIDVPNNQGPTFDLGPDITLSPGETYLIPGTSSSSDMNWSYAWNEESILSCISCIDPVVTPVMSTLLILEIADEQGCTHLDSIDISIIEQVPDSTGFYIPTVFSLADNAQDGSWTIGLDNTLIEAVHIRIYDRWGNLMADNNSLVDNNFIEAWDGRRDGKPVNIGVYVYMAEFLYMSGGRHLTYGHITLLR